jgi:hypothetical protein
MTDQLIKVTYPTVAGPERFGRKPILGDGSSPFGVQVCAIAAHFRNFRGRYSEHWQWCIYESLTVPV